MRHLSHLFNEMFILTVNAIGAAVKIFNSTFLEFAKQLLFASQPRDMFYLSSCAYCSSHTLLDYGVSDNVDNQ